MLVSLLLLLCLFESLNSFYLPNDYRIKRQARIRRAQEYLHKYGYFDNIPECPVEEKKNSFCPILKSGDVTEEEALKLFQQNAGLDPTGIIDDATVEMMEKARCGNSDARKLVKKGFRPWKKRKIYYKFLNFSDKLEKDKIQDVLHTAFLIWEIIVPLAFFETNKTEKADIKILFAKGDHGHEDIFDGPGGVFAHGYPDGRLHFDDDEEWRKFTIENTPVSPEKDLLYNAIHEIGHVLGLQHSTINPDSVMIPFYPDVTKQGIDGRYSLPFPITDDIENIQKIYGGMISKASKNAFVQPSMCTEYCFI